MSKREGETAVAVGDWRRAGYVPEALLGYLALLGFHPGDDREILSRAELLQAFSLERVGKSGSVFDPDKLRWMNAHYLHHAGGAQIRDWVEGAARSMPESGGWASRLEQLTLGQDRETRETLFEVVRGNVTTLAELPDEIAALLDATPDAESAAVLAAETARDVCKTLLEQVDALAEWNSEAFKSALRSAGKALGVKGRDLYQPVRAALTGRLHGPELPMIAMVLDRDQVVRRLLDAAQGRSQMTAKEGSE